MPSDINLTGNKINNSPRTPSVADLVGDNVVNLPVTLAPPPPPLVWQEYLYLDTRTGRRPNYFGNLLTKETTFCVPQEPYHPAEPVDDQTIPPPTSICTKFPAAPLEEEGFSEVEMVQRNPRGVMVCCLCGREDSNAHRNSKQHMKRLSWWSGASSADRRKWAEWVTRQW